MPAQQHHRPGSSRLCQLQLINTVHFTAGPNGTVAKSLVFLLKYPVRRKCWSILGMRTIPRGVQCPTHATDLQLGVPCHRVGVRDDRAIDAARRRIHQAATR